MYSSTARRWRSPAPCWPPFQERPTQYAGRRFRFITVRIRISVGVTYFLLIFFSRVFGIGGFARLTRGNVTVDEPMSEDVADVIVGGVQFGGGVRFRF